MRSIPDPCTCYNRRVEHMKPLSVKGVGENVKISFLGQDWEEAFTHLIDTLKDQSDFFLGARLVIDVGSMDIGTDRLSCLQHELSDRGMDLREVISTSEITRASASDLGIKLTYATGTDESMQDSPGCMEVIGEEAVFFQGTLRSGQSIRFPGHVAVLGDVNPGAEIIAGGNIVIWGRLRGTVHAGASGDEGALICALDLNPTQLRIGGHIAVSPERKTKVKPEIVRIREGRLIAEVWRQGR
jgi:septum site-determining protein MinC